MSDKSKLLASAALLPCLTVALFTAAPAHAQQAAQTVPQDGADQAPEIIVTGFRQSLQNAARIKRDSPQIQDSIVAEDIGKLPDTNIAETLQRVPGVQILRNARGEGNNYAVHGLTQVQTVLNGRVVFTTSNRNANLLDLSADILSGIDVYKTATADQIEGGLGGLINIRTARPFDYDGFRLVGSANANYSRIREKAEPRLAALVSNRWDTGIGEVGVLLGVTYERVTTGAYDTNVNTYVNRTDLIPGSTVTAPTQAQARYTYGDRTRFTVTGSAQWKPTDELSFYVDGLYAYSNGKSATQSLAVQTSAGNGSSAVPGSFTFKPGTTIPATASYRNAVMLAGAGATTNPYRIYQGAFGANWNSGGLTLSGEFSFSQSEGPFYSRSLNFRGIAPNATVDISGATPDVAISGVDPTNPAAFSYTTYSDLITNAFGKEPVVRFDAKYDFEEGFLKTLMAGVRYVHHTAITDQVSLNYNTGNSRLTQPAADVMELTPDKLFQGRTSSLNQWSTVGLGYIRDPRKVRELLGLNGDDPAFAAASHYEVREKVIAGYGEAVFGTDLGAIGIDGNVGLRALKTTSEQKTATAVGKSSYENYLPSANLRFKFTPDFFLRLAASKAISRPAYGDLSPALSLSPSSGTGSGGNPNLTPVKADQYDASLEYYFGQSNLIVASLFLKNVKGFVQSFAVDETIGGTVYRVSRPRNGGDGRIKGFEVSYQQFFDFLPGPFDGLGMQANYTYIDSSIEIVGRPDKVRAENLSKHNYNITGIYEKGPVSVRLAYNWRSDYVATTSADSSGRPLLVAPLGQLDLSMTYALTDRISLKFDAVNLTRTFREQYYLNKDYPQIANQFDRSIEAGVRVRF